MLFFYTEYFNVFLIVWKAVKYQLKLLYICSIWCKCKVFYRW